MSPIKLVVVLLLFSGGAYYAYDRFNVKQRLLHEIEQRDEVIGRLTRSSRVAQAMVTRRFTDEDGRRMTEVLFVEEGQEGEPRAKVRALVEGETVYFDALVLKFERALVEKGDSLKGKSVILFRRIFGENQNPTDGEPIDETAVDGIPAAYRGEEPPSSVEVALWRDFWKYANDPDAAKEAGVRVAQGEAPYIKMEEGKLYELTLDHDGGLNIHATKIPAIFMDEDS